MKQMLKQLEYHSKARRKLRRQICKKIRENINLFSGDFWIMRKIHGRWLGDLSDRKLIENCKYYILGEK